MGIFNNVLRLFGILNPFKILLTTTDLQTLLAQFFSKPSGLICLTLYLDLVLLAFHQTNLFFHLIREQNNLSRDAYFHFLLWTGQ